MTIDEVARHGGTTSRNVRAYQERGLLPPPRVVGRTGYYNETHLARLRHIAALADRGFSLASIRTLFDAWEQGYGLADVLGFEEALATPWRADSGLPMTADELTNRFGGTPDTLALGVLVPEGDDGFRVMSTRLLDAAQRLSDMGIPLSVLLAEAERLAGDLDAIAERWVAVFKDHLWDDAVARGLPPSELQAITELLRGMRELMGEIIGPLLAQSMDRRANALAADTIAARPPTPAKRAATRKSAARKKPAARRSSPT
jgi:DNA-binding transcriptional MerR regulator